MENKESKIKSKTSLFIVHYRNPKGSTDYFILFYGVEQFSFTGQAYHSERALPAYSQQSVCNRGAEDSDINCQVLSLQPF